MIKKILAGVRRPYQAIVVSATALVSCAASIASPADAWLVSIVALIGICTQIVLLDGANLRDKLVPLRRLTPQDVAPPWRYAKPAASLIAIAPLTSVISPILAIALSAGLALASAKPAAIYLKDILLRRRLRKSAQNDFASTSPKVALYLSGPREVYYQVNQWLPVLERLSVPVAIILRNRDIFEGMKKTTVPVFFVREGRDVESFYNGGVELVLYPNNREKNVNSLRHHQLTHIFINHGESDKSVNQSKMLMAYDYLFVGGPLAEQRLRSAGLPIRDGQIVHVGRPQAELFLVNVPQTERIEKILYAPTWEGGVAATSYSSVGPVGLKLLRDLAASGKYEVAIKPHPLTGRTSAETAAALQEMSDLSQKFGMKFLHASESLHEWMNWSDLMICDVSAVLNEYLITSKPIVLCNILGASLQPEELAQEFPSSTAAYILGPSDPILSLMDRIEARDDLRSARSDVRRHSMGAGDSFDRFEDNIRLHLSQSPQEILPETDGKTVRSSSSL